MKKIVCAVLCMIILLATGLSVAAADTEVVFTQDSSFEVDGTVSVDTVATQSSVMDDPEVSAQMLDAAANGYIQYQWFCDDSWYTEGTSITLTEQDQGHAFFCRAYFYSDSSYTEDCGYIDSATFTVAEMESSMPDFEITTGSLEEGTVGQSYYQQITCSEENVVYSLFDSTLPEGLSLSENGEITGTPTEAGFWYVMIMAIPEEGESYAATAEFELTINEAASRYSMEIMELPQKTTYFCGEQPDMTGLWVRIYTPDGYLDSHNGEDLIYSRRELLTTGEQTVTLSYEDARAVFTIEVIPEPEETTEATTEATTVETTEETVEVTTEETVPVTTGAADNDQTTGEQTEGSNARVDWIFWGLLGLAAALAIAATVLCIVMLCKQKKK